MKGRTKCPKCDETFLLDIPKDCTKHEVKCPKCKNKFTIKPVSKKLLDEEECTWEEYGEPRKTNKRR